jgi:hypothetical protein
MLLRRVSMPRRVTYQLPAASTITSDPGVENYVNSQNPGNASGTFGVGGTALISATSSFRTCTIS